jgi:cbb3-type cytochrome oxidase maturation protein
VETLYLLIPLSAGLVLVILAVFGWALQGGQFEDLEREGERILTDDAPRLDSHQAPGSPPPPESAQPFKA